MLSTSSTFCVTDSLTGVVNVQLVDDALVPSAEHHHEVLDGHGAVAVAGARGGAGGVAHLLPLEDGRGGQHGGGRGDAGPRGGSGFLRR